MLHPRPFPRTAFSRVALVVALCPGAPGRDEAFPAASPESQGMSSTALEAFASEVEGFVDQGFAVGAELLVIKNRRTVLHRTWGWRDREAEEPLEIGTLYNLRSMTKTLTGAAA